MTATLRNILIQTAQSWMHCPGVPLREAEIIHRTLRSHPDAATHYHAEVQHAISSLPPNLSGAVRAVTSFASLMAPSRNGQWVAVLAAAVCAVRPSGAQTRRWLPALARIPAHALAPLIDALAASGLTRVQVAPRLVPAHPMLSGQIPWTAHTAARAAAMFDDCHNPTPWHLWDELCAHAIRQSPWAESSNGKYVIDARVIPIVAADRPDILLCAIGGIDIPRAATTIAREVRRQYELCGPGEGVAAAQVVVPMRDTLYAALEASAAAALQIG